MSDQTVTFSLPSTPVTQPTQQQQPVTQPAQQPPAQSQDVLLAGKYKSVDELVRGYKELESRMGQQPAQALQVQTQQQQPVTQPAQQPASTQVAPLDMQRYEREYLEKGSLSPEAYQELGRKGITPELVNQYIQSRQTASEVQVNQVLQEVGGREAFNQMAQWAAGVLSPADKAHFNRLLQSGDVATATMAARDLQRRYVEANGQPPVQLIDGQAVRSVGGYATQQEALAAMNDPRYTFDAAYQHEVARKVSLSNFGRLTR